MEKTIDQLRLAFQKANQARKLILLQRMGCKTKEEYFKLLENSKPVVKVKTSKVVKKKTIHIITILDASGSMSGGKYTNSCNGIRQEVEELKVDQDANYTYTFVEFVQRGKIIKNVVKASLKDLYLPFNGALGGDTPLYDTVYNTLRDLESISSDDKVLVKVYTDGGDNSSWPEYKKMSKDLIATLEKRGFVITFVATEQDMPRIVHDLSLNITNTLSVTNDSIGFQNAFFASNIARKAYTSSVAAGTDTNTGFYKKSVDLKNK